MRSFRFLAARAVDRLLSPLIPAKKMLPFTYWLNRAGGYCEAELVHLKRFCGSSGVALDIGANQGHYAFALSKWFERVYAFEANEEVTKWIRLYDSERIEIIHCALSCEAGTARLFVPVVRGMVLSGWASLDRSSLAQLSPAEICEKDVPIARLDDFAIGDVGFVKIDVEGHEVEVLKGGTTTIRQSRPVVLIELRDQTYEAVKSWFLDLNYSIWRLQDFLPVRGEEANYIFLPNERIPELDIRRRTGV